MKYTTTAVNQLADFRRAGYGNQAIARKMKKLYPQYSWSATDVSKGLRAFKRAPSTEASTVGVDTTSAASVNKVELLAEVFSSNLKRDTKFQIFSTFMA